MIRTSLSLPAALVRPDRVFAGREIYAIPKVLLVLGLFVLYVAGERLVQGYYQNSHAKTLALLEVDSRMGGFLQNAPAQVQRQARAQMLDSILGQRSAMMTSVSIVGGGIGFIIVLLEAWLVSTVTSQFFGGQEEKTRRGRPSWTLFLVAWLPLALRRLLSGILLTLRSPDAASNALTLADYRRLSAVRFDLYSLLHLPEVNAFLTGVARMATDPFFLWTLAIIWFGGREVYHMPLRSAVYLSVIIVVLLGLQGALLARAGLTWEL
jgi:hypothetical protein